MKAGEREEWRETADGGRIGASEGREVKKGEWGMHTKTHKEQKEGRWEGWRSTVDVHIKWHKNNKHRKKKGR